MKISQGIKKYLTSLNKDVQWYINFEKTRLKSFERELTPFVKDNNLTEADRNRIEFLKKECQSRSQRLKDLIENKKLLENEKSITKNFLRLKKHPLIVGIEAESTYLSIFTKPLKAKLKKKKKNIGYYQINLYYKPVHSIRIENLYKTVDGNHHSNLDHWFVQSTKPCFGNWMEGIREYLNCGNFYLAIDSILHFLQSTYKTRQGYATFSQFTRKY